MYGSVLPHAVPGLPDRCRAFFHRIEPSGTVFLQEKPVSRIGMSVVRKYTAQIRRRQESGIQMITVLPDEAVEIIADVLRQHKIGE